jgi:acrylyl-CoA reductase (NADPH)
MASARLVRKYLHIGGVDFTKTIERSNSRQFTPGDKVVLTAWRVGRRVLTDM